MSLGTIIGKVLVLATVYTAQIAKSLSLETDIYGTWHIDKMVMERYIETPDEEYPRLWYCDIREQYEYEPEGYIGLELEYTEDFLRIGDQAYQNPRYTFDIATIEELNGYDSWEPTFYQYIEEEGIILKGEKDGDISRCKLPWVLVYVDYGQKYIDKNGEEYPFPPIGDECVLLNDDTMLLGTWGKILMATRIDGGRAEKWDKLEEMVWEMDKEN